MHTKNPDYVAVAETVFSENFSDAACGFIAGSMLRGEATSSSDIDLIILYDDRTSPSYRRSIIAEGWPVEIFVQNLAAQDYFLQQDVTNGTSMTASMIACGHVIGSDHRLARSRKDTANIILEQGPERWTAEKIDNERYFITDLWDDLRAPKDRDAIPFILANLMPRLGNFYFRSQGKWSGSGKALIRLMKQDNAAFAQQFMQAFDDALQGDNRAVQALVSSVLEPYGGLLFEGYTAYAKGWQPE